MITREDLDKSVYYIVMAILVGLPTIKFISYGLYLLNFTGSIFTLNQVYLLWIMIPFSLIVYLIGIFTKNNKINYADYIIYSLILLAILSTIFAFIPKTAIFGEKYRYEGLLSIVSYYLLFLNVKHIKDKKIKEKIIWIFLGVGLFQTVYGILQVYTNVGFVRHFSTPYMAMGLCGNPNFFGSYIIMHLLICIGLYLLDHKRLYLLLSLLFFVCLCVANSSGPFLGFIIAFLFFIIAFFKKIKLRYLLFIIITLITLFYSNNYIVKYIHNNKFHTSMQRAYVIADELTDTIKNFDNESIANGRVTVWKNSLPLVKKYWLVGAGLDNFGNVYEHNNRYVRFDKAHNVYLQMAITNGLPALIIYCILCLIVFIKGFKFKDNYYIVLYLAFVGYCIQAFANISVIDVAPCFFIILGLIYSNEDMKKIIKK